MNERIVYLEISSFKMYVYNAVHYCGRLRCGEESADLARTLSAAEAEEFNRIDGFSVYEEGDETWRFKSKSQLKSLAVQTYREHFPDAVFLIRGSHTVADPQFVLDGPDPWRTTLNELFAQADRLGWWDGGEKDAVREVCDEWDAVLQGGPAGRL